jgi:Uma2 family endonuclease
MSMPAETRRRYSVEEYLAMEEKSPEKHEYRDGEIVAMAGGTENHSLICINITATLRNALRNKPCRVYDSNLRVAIPRDRRFVYPDGFVICGPSAFHPQAPNSAVTNPKLIVEVLSDSTEAYDRGEKFTRYRTIESLEEYVLVDQKSAHVEVFFRQNDGTWLLTPAAGVESTVHLRSLDVSLALAEVYAKVEFAPPLAQPNPESQGSAI